MNYIELQKRMDKLFYEGIPMIDATTRLYEEHFELLDRISALEEEKAITSHLENAKEAIQLLREYKQKNADLYSKLQSIREVVALQERRESDPTETYYTIKEILNDSSITGNDTGISGDNVYGDSF